MKQKSNLPFSVVVIDNFRSGFGDDTCASGSYATLEEAIIACKGIVDDWLTESIKQGIKTEALYGSYKMFGDDPFIVGFGSEEKIPFSGWEYAEERCKQICSESVGSLTEGGDLVTHIKEIDAK